MSQLPYLPDGYSLQYVALDHPFMEQAASFAQAHSLDKTHPTGAVLVQDGQVIGLGANGSEFHEKVGCVRKWFHIPTGQKYWLCPGCSPRNHAEQQAIRNAQKAGHKTAGAAIYLWGHWWCCHSCWDVMIAAGIKDVYLVQDAASYFG